MKQVTRFVQLKEVFRRLHGPRGCLWDKEQTHQTILPQLQEEVDEFIAAVRAGDPGAMREELGDVLLHVMFHAQIASKQERFDIEDVIAELIRKLKRRHPHVFGSQKVDSTSQIIANWQRIKKQEKKRRDAGTQKHKDRYGAR